jgi:hypothetical protein
MADKTQAARGSDKDYCSYWGSKPGPDTDPDSPHHMSSRSTGSKDVPFVEQCSFCGWIDGEALQRYADAAVKMSISHRAQRIAIAADMEPFAFVEVADHNTPLTLDEILLQALAAASRAYRAEPLELLDTERAKSIYIALKAEVDRSIEVEVAETLDAAQDRVRKFMRDHFSAGTIEETVRAVRGGQDPPVLRSFRYGGSF